MTRVETQQKMLIVGCGSSAESRLLDAIRNEPTWKVIAHCQSYFPTLRHVLRHRPDLVLIDMDLSRSDPFQLATIIHAVSPQTRLLFLCDHPTDDQINKVLSMRAGGLICRNNQTDAVLTAIRDVATGGISYCQTILMRLIIDSDGIRLGSAVGRDG